MKIGDVVRINQDPLPVANTWCVEAQGKVGVIISVGNRLYIPSAKVMVLGEIVDFDVDELTKIEDENRER